MARHALRVAFAIVAFALGCASTLTIATNAQTLAKLHVRQFQISIDKTSVAVGEPFHLTLDLHLDERVASLDNVQLPSLAGFEDLGDERRCTIAPIGTDCVETLTIDSLTPGDRTLGPASIEFVDGTTGHSKSLQSNVVVVHVTGTAKIAPEPVPEETANPISGLLWNVLRFALTLVCVAVAAYALVWGYGRRPRAPVPVPLPPVEAPPGPPPASISWDARMRELGEMLAADPTRPRAVAVRSEIRAHIGAGERETIADLAKRNAAAGDHHVMRALVAVDRAAFCEDDRVADAAREAVPFLMQ